MIASILLIRSLPQRMRLASDPGHRLRSKEVAGERFRARFCRGIFWTLRCGSERERSGLASLHRGWKGEGQRGIAHALLGTVIHAMTILQVDRNRLAARVDVKAEDDRSLPEPQVGRAR